MSTTTILPDAFFSITNPHNPHAVARSIARKATYQAWLSGKPQLEDDIDTTALSLVNTWALTEGHIKAGLRALHRLDTLPKVKALQEKHYVLDIESLIAIDQPMSALAGPTTATLALIDGMLADYFTPTKPNQAFPTRAQIRRKVRDLCKALDDTIAYRDTRPKDTYTFYSNGTTAWLELGVDENTGIKLDAFIRKTAAHKGLSLTEAVKKLLSGEITPPATVILNTYRACDVDNAPTYVEGFGWKATPMPHEKQRDLTKPSEETDSYRPGVGMRKEVEGRDGTCRINGCTEPAHHTQLDHRHNYADGGATHPSNLACLCQKHHNMKTDGTLHYLLDPNSGDIIWLFQNGTWCITEPEGPLAPKQKRWAQTVGQHITTTRTRIREQAQRLKQALDDYHQQQTQAEETAETETAAQTGENTDTTDDIPF